MKLIAIFLDGLYGKSNAVFATNLPVDVAVKKLSAGTKRSLLLNLFSDDVVGKVSKNSVRLSRAKNNAFAPFFIGRFSIESGGTTLKGDFQLRPWVQVFATIWFGFVFLWIVFVVTVLPYEAAIKGISLWKAIGGAFVFGLPGIAFFVVAFLLLRYAKNLSKRDVQVISDHIKAHLQDVAA